MINPAFQKNKNNLIKYQNLIRVNEENEPNTDEEEGEEEEEEKELDDKSFNSNVNKICGKATKNLKNYFQTYDKS